MADALPTHPKGDDSSDLASSYEVIGLLVHAYLAAIGFKLCGFNEDKNLPEAESLAPRLPPQWNDGYGSIRFVYAHKQSSMRFVISIDKIGSKVEIRGLAIGDENIHRFEKKIADVAQSKNLPVRITVKEEGEEDRSDLVEKLSKIFVSEEAISSILHDLKVNIIQKLIPKLQSDGYIEEAEAEANANAERRAQQDPRHLFPGNPRPNVPNPEPYPNPGLMPDLARPRPQPHSDIPMPGFEDEHDILRGPRGGVMPAGPPRIGDDDLNPPGLGSRDPLVPSFTPGWGRPDMPRPGGHSGMHPTFDDPLFRGDGSGQPGGYDPRAPPGARYDPTMPGAGPRFPRPGGQGGGNGQGGGFGGFGGAGGGII